MDDRAPIMLAQAPFSAEQLMAANAGGAQEDQVRTDSAEVPERTQTGQSPPPREQPRRSGEPAT